MAGRHRRTGGPTGVEEHPASMLGDPELDTHTAEASCAPKCQTGRDGDCQRRCGLSQTPLAEGTILWEEPGRDD